MAISSVQKRDSIPLTFLLCAHKEHQQRTAIVHETLSLPPWAVNYMQGIHVLFSEHKCTKCINLNKRYSVP